MKLRAPLDYPEKPASLDHQVDEELRVPEAREESSEDLDIPYVAVDLRRFNT